MLPGGSLLENFWSLVSQTMRLPIELQLAVIHYSETVFVSMGVLASEFSIDFIIAIGCCSLLSRKFLKTGMGAWLHSSAIPP